MRTSAEEMIRETMTQPEAGSTDDFEGSSSTPSTSADELVQGNLTFRALPTSTRRGVKQRSSVEVAPGFSKRTYGVNLASYESITLAEQLHVRSKCAKLDEQLEELRALLPHSASLAGKMRSDPSVVMDAYRYIVTLQQEVEDLSAEVQESEDLDSRDHHEQVFVSGKMSEAQLQRQPLVEVMRRDGVVEVRIVCANRPGLLVDVMEAVESRGLSVAHARIACHSDDTTASKYLSSPVKNEEISATISLSTLVEVADQPGESGDSELGTVKGMLMDAICEGNFIR